MLFYFTLFLSIHLVACECSTSKRRRLRSSKKRRTNKIGIRAWNKKCMLRGWLAGWLVGWFVSFFVFVLHLNSATKTHIFKHKMMVFLVCFMYTIFFCLKCYGFGSTLILNQLNYDFYVIYVCRLIRCMFAGMIKGSLQKNT